jgi:membrane protease YdiL (CAAX protease family)
MIFIVGTLIVSWGLLWLFERSHLGPLGLEPTLVRVEQFLFGLVVSALVASLGLFAVTIITASTVSINPDFTLYTFLKSSWWMLKSVLTEELLFRGALLYIAIRFLGTHRGCMLSAVAFGIYHWFSYNIFGNPVQMIYIFLLTGLAGVMFAYAFAYSRGMYLPIGLHLGWNLVTVVVFSQGPLGDQLLVVQNGPQVGWLTLPFFLYQVAALPALTWWYVKSRGHRLLSSARDERSSARG